MNQKLDKLKVLLRELFQLDQPDLDFGIYRVLHAKSGEISKFLDDDLLPQVKAAFGQYKSADKAEIEKQLAELRKSVADAGLDPDDSPKVKELSAKLANESVDLSRLEGEVYDHLFGFFRRYYSEGDFLSKRVYKEGVYAIPYEGDEVKLHWANADQYYIKTSEYLRDYAFRLKPDANEEAGEDPMRVHFRLIDAAEGEHGNVKEGEGKNRVFILESSDFIEEENGELVIKLEYRPASLTDWPDHEREGKKKPPVQKDLLKIAEDRLLATEEVTLLNWISELGKSHIKADGELADYSRLRAHLNRYSARNTFDYFVHKDLGGFLRRELDFYIKNEVMHLDDIESDTAPRVEQYLSKIKVIRSIAGKIIDFLAQLEDFQKKLWLKKKFVVETSYLIRVGIIPEEFYPEIVANDAQREEWVRLYSISEFEETATLYSDPLTTNFLKAFPTLMVNTSLYDSGFTQRILASTHDIDTVITGTVINSDNFHALATLNPRFSKEISAIYIDPPYNVPGAEIIYKNEFLHSSWLSLVENRRSLSVALLSNSGFECITVDDYEKHRLMSAIDAAGQSDNVLGVVCIRNNPSGRATVTGFAVNHEYAIFIAGSVAASLGRFEHTEKQRQRYDQTDENGLPFEWENMRKSSAGSLRADRPKQHFAIFVDGTTLEVSIPQQTWVEATRKYDLDEQPRPDEKIVYPVGPDGIERVWSIGIEKAKRDSKLLLAEGDHERIEIYKRKFLNLKGVLPRTWWDKPEYSARDRGTRLLRDMLGRSQPFDFPKALVAVIDCLRVCSLEEDGIVLDYFAGSGTTGHATIAMNREDAGSRKFILAEAGPYFHTVLVPRLAKATYSPEWSNGKPARTATPEEAESSPGIIKIISLESYEDALNNLELKRTEVQEQTLFGKQADTNDTFREQYMLRYMLDVETRGSRSILNVELFADPTAYKLKVKRPGSDESREVNVDLLETFNWLIGLTVQQIAAPMSFSAEFEKDSEGRLRLRGRLKQDAEGPFWFRTVAGATPDGRRTLVIWRKLTGNTEEDNLALDEWFTRQGYSSKDSEFDLIYVNGGNNLENLRTTDDLWKVRLIEEDFHRLMFDTEDV
ncbi:MAG: DNA methyltransferase [Pyrinomonadaceae bacterium]